MYIHSSPYPPQTSMYVFIYSYMSLTSPPRPGHVTFFSACPPYFPFFSPATFCCASIQTVAVGPLCPAFAERVPASVYCLAVWLLPVARLCLFFFYLIVQPAVWLLGRRGGLSGRQRLSCGWTWLIPCARVVCLFACSANRQPANLPACYTVSGASRPVFAARAAAAFLNHTLTCPPPPARTSPRH